MAGLRLAPHNPLDLNRLGAVLGDGAELNLIANSVHMPFDAKQWQDWLSAPHIAPFFIMSGAQTVGHFVFKCLRPDEKHVSWLFVKPEARGNGRALMALIMDQARGAGAKAVTLNVFPQNLRAKHLYAACGFGITDETSDRISMRKDLL